MRRGIPATRKLANRFQVTGVDSRASSCSALRRMSPTPGWYRATSPSWTSLTRRSTGSPRSTRSHISHEPSTADLSPRSLAGDAGGLFLATLGASDLPDWTGEWLGAPMFFSSHDAATNRRLLLDAGLILMVDEVVSTNEPEGEVSFLWVLAQKPSMACRP